MKVLEISLPSWGCDLALRCSQKITFWWFFSGLWKKDQHKFHWEGKIGLWNINSFHQEFCWVWKYIHFSFQVHTQSGLKTLLSFILHFVRTTTLWSRLVRKREWLAQSHPASSMKWGLNLHANLSKQVSPSPWPWRKYGSVGSCVIQSIGSASGLCCCFYWCNLVSVLERYFHPENSLGAT